MFDEASERLTPSEQQQLAALLLEYELDLCQFNKIKHRIDMAEAALIREWVQRTPLGFQHEEKQHLNKMPEAGIVEPSHSEWVSPIVLV